MYTSHKPNQEHNQRQRTKRNTLLDKKSLSLSYFILERVTHFVVSLRDKWTDIYSERGFLLAPYLLPGAGGFQSLHPLASHIVKDAINASDRLRIPGSTLDSDWTDCVNLTAWFSYHVVSFRLHTCLTCLPRRIAIPCLLITTWQLVKALEVTKNEPIIHVNSHYITHVSLPIQLNISQFFLHTVRISNRSVSSSSI